MPLENPIRSFRSQLEAFIAEQRGKGWLASAKHQTELRKIKKEIAALKKSSSGLEARKAALEQAL